MGKVYSSLVKRPAQNWNVASRAEAELAREKPTVAPKHPSVKAQIEQFQQEHPELLEAQRLKDEKLLGNLQDLVVEPEKFGTIVSVARDLPQDRAKHSDPEYGYLEPHSIPDGKCSVRQVLEFITSHQVEPESFTASRIARDYKLDTVNVQDVLKHFNIHMMQLPRKPMDSEALPGPGPAEPRSRPKELGTGLRNLLGGGGKETETRTNTNPKTPSS